MSNGNTDDESRDGHNYTEAVGTRLSPETRDRLEDYKEEHEISNSEALRRLVRQGLDAEEDDQDDMVPAFTISGVLAVVIGISDSGGPVIIVFGILLLLAAVFLRYTKYQLP